MRFSNVQALRAIAAMLVVAHHFLLATHTYGPGNPLADFMPLTEFGASGVDLFFCISGFVMLISMQKLSSQPHPTKRFAWGRLIRIAPMYWIATAIFIAMTVTTAAGKHGLQGVLHENFMDPVYIASSFVLWPAVSPVSHELQPYLAQGWTLSYEFYFYILLMLACRIASFDLKRAAVLTALGMVLLRIAVPDTLVVGQFLSRNVLFEFCFGMLVFFGLRLPTRYGLACLVIGTLSLVATAAFHVDDPLRLFFWGIPAGLILMGAVMTEGRWKVGPIWQLLGEASYSIYLTHGFLIYLYGGLIKRGVFSSVLMQDALIVAGIVGSALVGIAFHLAIERPVGAWLGTLFASKKVSRPVPSA